MSGLPALQPASQSIPQHRAAAPLANSGFLQDAHTKARPHVWDSQRCQVPPSFKDVRTLPPSPLVVQDVHTMTAQFVLTSPGRQVHSSSEHVHQGQFRRMDVPRLTRSQDSGKGQQTPHRLHSPQTPWDRLIFIPPGSVEDLGVSNGPASRVPGAEYACSKTAGCVNSAELESVGHSIELTLLRLRMAGLQDRMQHISCNGRSIPASLRAALT
eukprot:CAMPEP_0172910392 /NCGR_PEP_ID=MMETSP1075-20121228/184554_1 /TAXON_ID=2916 /ORGANISM="Ceratium fusus, Strain PA161109" /LENGTH=212 /DNA_ID=CAMNT_0013768521 /DNA_START=515 /DNA_END=1150 /DNA_ORIENTATION=+